MEGEEEELGTESLAGTTGLELPLDLRLSLDGPCPWMKGSLEEVGTGVTLAIGVGRRCR